MIDKSFSLYAIDKAFDQLDRQRATQAYLELTSMYAMFESHERDYGMTTAGDVGLYSKPGAGKVGAIGLTYNTESVYSDAKTDLLIDGPTVVELPEGEIRGAAHSMNDKKGSISFT